MKRFSIDPHAGEPPFEQLRRQVIDGVRSGELVAGERMPTVRGLATDLGLAANTVAKAYRALEADGVIVTGGRAGSVISATGDVTHQQAQASALAFATRIRELGIDDDEAAALVAAALRAR